MFDYKKDKDRAPRKAAASPAPDKANLAPQPAAPPALSWAAVPQRGPSTLAQLYGVPGLGAGPEHGETNTNQQTDAPAPSPREMPPQQAHSTEQTDAPAVPPREMPPQKAHDTEQTDAPPPRR